MFGYTYFHDLTRKYISLFGTLFNDIYISRQDSDGNTTSMFRVPIMYGPREKALARVNADPELNRPWAAVLPIMTFNLKGMYYDGDRHLNTLNRWIGKRPGLGSKNVVPNIYNPVAYTLNFELQITVKNAADGPKIIEQIIPFFTPDWTATVRLIEDPEIIVDITTILNPINMEDNWQGSFDSTRYITYTLSFQMLGYFFGPVHKDKIIKKSIGRVGAINKEGQKLIDGGVIVTPGLTPDGKPTSDANESLAWSDIDWNDDYGFIEETYIE